MKVHELTKTERDPWTSYQRMRVQLAGVISRELTRETGLSEADYEILTALLENSDKSVRAMALRCGLSWEKSRLSHQLKRMEQRGLVAREECVEDNRGTLIRVTDLGRERAEAARRIHDGLVQRYIGDVLTAEQMDELGAIAEAVLARLPVPQHS
jgi:DNA-binding MarR family transcriptional regulator